MMKEHSIKIGKKVFENPFFVGSSDLVSTCKQAEEVIKYGKLGSIIWKTTTIEPREGYKQPRICDFYNGFLVASGMRNPGLENTIEEIKKFKEKHPEQSVIISIASVRFEDPVQEFEIMAKKLKEIPVDGIELNLSCPHQVAGEKQKTELLAQNASLVGKIVSKVTEILKGTEKIVAVKLTGWNADVSNISKVAEINGADAITVSNIFPGTGYYTGLNTYKNGFSYQIGEPLLGNFKGGYTGVAMLPATLLIVNTVKNAVSIPVIATGGCMTSNDAMIQAFLAGATAIASATFFYDEDCLNCRNFSKELLERKAILKEFIEQGIVKT